MALKTLDTIGLEQAQAIQLLKLHNSELSFQGFVYLNTVTPATHTKNKAWIVAESGATFGISAHRGQIIIDNGTSFVTKNFIASVQKEFKTLKNIFNRYDADYTAGYYVNNATGELAANAVQSATGWIPVTGSTAYYFSYKHMIAWYDSGKVYISGSSSTDTNQAQTSPVNACYLRATLLVSNVAAFQIELGSSGTAYEAFEGWYEVESTVRIDTAIQNSQVVSDLLASKCDIAREIGKNKFNLNDADCATGYYVNSTTGALAANAIHSATGWIPVTGSTAYYFSYKHMIAWYNTDKVYVSGSSSTDTNKTQTSPANARYLRATLLVSNVATFQIEEGTVNTEYETWYSNYVVQQKIKGTDILNLSNALSQIIPLPVGKTGKNKFNPNDPDFVTGFYVHPDYKALGANADYCASGYIPVTAGQTYTLSLRHFLAWFNTAKDYISGSNIITSPKQVTAPAGAAYLRCSIHINSLATFQAEVGVQETLWEAYYSYQTYEDLSYEADKIIGLGNEIAEKLVTEIGFLKTNRLAMPLKQYFLGGYENTIYHAAICERHLKDLYFVQLENGTFVNRNSFSRITNPVADSSVDCKLYNLDFESVDTKTFALLVGSQSANNGTITINAIGDSLTYNSSYLKRVRELCPDLAFSGMRIPETDSAITVEGRGGWKLDTYFTRLFSSTDPFSPFLQPADPYKYYGNTDFWKKVVTGDTSYGYAGFATKAAEIGFSASTGLKTTPATNDVMYNDVNARYERWDGSAWVLITLTLADFSFKYAKYRSIWEITQPNIVTVMLGTNDFLNNTPASIDALFDTWKTQFETLVTSVHADSPLAKIALLISPSVWGGSNNTIDSFSFNAKYNAAMWRARKKIIENFDGRETTDKIYLVDVGSALDPVYGFAYAGAAEKPFSDYTGTETVKVQTNSPHPSTQGYYQMGIRLAGWIQSVR